MCIFDLGQGELLSWGTRIWLCARNPQYPTIAQVEVTVPETFTVAAFSEVEVLGEMPVSCRGDWMVENKLLKKPQVLVDRAVVLPQNGCIPMHMLNLEPQPVTVYKGTKGATAEAVIPCEDVSAVDNVDDLE